jgi:hypothetical protein
MPTYTKTNTDTSAKPGVTAEQKEEESFESPIQTVENPDYESYARDLAFMAEPVEVLVLDSQDKNDTTRLVSISVDGKSHYLLRGQWTTVPRYVLEILATAKKEAWQFGYRTAPDGSTFETSKSTHLLRYPHHFRDKNPKGAAWYDSIKDRVR